MDAERHRHTVIDKISFSSTMMGAAAGYDIPIYIRSNDDGKWINVDDQKNQKVLLIDSGEKDDQYVTSVFYLNRSNLWAG